MLGIMSVIFSFPVITDAESIKDVLVLVHDAKQKRFRNSKLFGDCKVCKITKKNLLYLTRHKLQS